MSHRQVALLRGINVGGKNMLPMKTLATLFVNAGCTRVSTYIQSGNVLFDAPPARAKALPAVLARAIRDELGLAVPVVLRSAAEMRATLTHNPFLPRAEPGLLYVGFLAAAPGRAQVAALDPARSPPDEFAVVGRDIYLCLPNGAGGTKLTNAYLDRVLGTVSTLRNWRTVQKLAELSASP